MADRFGSDSLLALATAVCVAALGLSLGAACDRSVHAQTSNQRSNTGGVAPAQVDPPKATADDPSPVGGGPVEGRQAGDGAPVREPGGAQEVGPSKLGPDDLDKHTGGSDAPEERGAPPNGDRSPAEDEAFDGQDGVPGDDESASPNQDGTGEEDSPSEENWQAPVRGSGEDNPPDFIVPSEPKLV